MANTSQNLRINPTTKQVELLLPTGEWSSSALEEQIKGIASQVQGISSALGNQPIDVNAIGNGNKNLVLPGNKLETPDIGDSKASTSSMESFIDLMTKQSQNIQTQLAEARANQAKGQDLLNKATTNITPDITALVQQQKDIVAKIYPNQQADIAEVKTLQEEYDKAVAAKEQGMLNIENKQMPMELIVGEQAAYEKQANIRLNQMAGQINTKIGLMNLNQGNADKAMTFIDKAIDNYTAEKKFEYQQYQDFMNMNYNQIRDLDTKYQNILNTGLSLAKYNYEEQVKEKQAVRDLMLQTNGKAGIILDDSLDSATKKASAWLAAQPKETLTPSLQQEQTEIANVSARLSVTKGKDGYVDPQAYLAEKRKSTISPTEFDNRFADLLSPQERVNLGIEKQNNIQLTLDQIKVNTKNIFQQYKDSGYARQQIEDQWKADNGGTDLSPMAKSVLDELFGQSKNWWEFWK